MRINLAQLGAGGFHSLADRADSGQQSQVLCLELDALLLGLLELFFPLGELSVEKLDRLAGFIAVPGQVFLDKYVDHFLNDIAR